MRNERSISLPGLLLGFSVDGGVAAAAVPAAARTVLSLPQAALGDGTAQALRMRRMSGSRTGCILMSRGYPMFGAGGLSDAGLSAFRHEALRRLELPEDELALLLQGTRRELTPVGGLVERCTEAWKRAGGEALLPEGWTGFEMPFMTQDGVMRVGALSAGGAVPTENRVLLLATDVPVREVILQRIADRAAGPLFAWLRAVGVLSAADVVMVVSAAGRRPVASIDDPAAEMLARALELAVGRVSEAWAGALGRNIRVRLEGLRDEEEAEHLIAALAGVGGWLRGAGTPREVSLVLRAALEQSALPGLEASGFAMRLGECADALSLASAQELSNLQEGRAAITLAMARGNLSTTFCV